MKYGWFSVEVPFVFICITSSRVFQELQKAGVIVRPMAPYGFPEYVRISIGTAAENQRLIATLQTTLGLS